MRYIPPFGATEGPYRNGDASTGEQGSIPPAAVFEEPQREILGVIEKSGLTPTNADLLQMAKGIQSSHLIYAEDTGSTNNLSVVLDPPIAAYRRGLVVNVRVRRTNTGAVRINAGAGYVPVRKINGAELDDGNLPAGAIATLVFDGTVFQTSSVGFGGGDTEIFQVKIPYTVDSSPQRDIVRANFSPEITTITAGDMIAVKIANTNYGPTLIYVNNQGPFNMRPNGGGMMLQGDIQQNDIVIMFFDGQSFSFAPNAEINSWVMYTVGNGQQFASVEACIDAIRRKTIGANGYVHIQLAQQTFYAAIGVPWVARISHPSADRIAIVGTMIGPNPEWWEFRATSNQPAGIAQDAIFNANMLRTRYGTIIQVPFAGYPNSTHGILNAGPGMPALHHLLVMGNRPGVWPQGWAENGVLAWAGFAVQCYNVTVWGCSMAFYADGARLHAQRCYAVASTHHGFNGATGGHCSMHTCGAFGNDIGGIANASGFLWSYNSVVLANKTYGYYSQGASDIDTWYATSLGNGYADMCASIGATIISSWTVSVGVTSPAWNTTGNLNSVIALAQGLEFAPPPIPG